MSAINNVNKTNGNRYNSQSWQFQVKMFIANSYCCSRGSNRRGKCYQPNNKKVTNVKLFSFLILFLNVFELFVTKKFVPNFCGKKCIR
jgi:hypothetical protein